MYIYFHSLPPGQLPRPILVWRKSCFDLPRCPCNTYCDEIWIISGFQSNRDTHTRQSVRFWNDDLYYRQTDRCARCRLDHFKVRQIYCQSHLKTILHRFFNTSQKYCQLMKMVLISKIWLGPAASPLFLAPLFPLPPPATRVPECCECAIKYQEIDDNWIVSFKNTTRTICSRKVREIEPRSLILDPRTPLTKGVGSWCQKVIWPIFSIFETISGR